MRARQGSPKLILHLLPFVTRGTWGLPPGKGLIFEGPAGGSGLVLGQQVCGAESCACWAAINPDCEIPGLLADGGKLKL